MLTYESIESIVNTIVPGVSISNPTQYNSVEAEPEFAKKVRSAAVLLKANNPFSYEDIRRATLGVYYQVALRIAAARFPSLAVVTKDASGAETLNSNLTVKQWQWLTEEINCMITPGGQGTSTSPDTERLKAFSGGIEYLCSKLTAAHLIRNIPLNNSSLKFVDVADNLEKQALEDLERLIKVSEGNSSSGSSSSSASNLNSKGQSYLGIAHNLDLNTIPEASFNAPDVPPSPVPAGYTPTYTNTIFLQDVETVNTLSVEADEVGICYFYMTGQSYFADQDLINSADYSISSTTAGLAGNPQHSASVSYKIEKAFPLIGQSVGVTNLNIDDLITILADEINTETLNVIGEKVANIVAAPERGKPKTTTETITKRELYPNTTLLKNRRASFTLYHHINKLSFDVRRYSNKASTELLVIAFYTVDAADWALYNPAPNDFIYNSTTPDPEKLRSKDILGIIKSKSKLGINGLIFGEDTTYSELGTKVPYSSLLNVEKGNVSAVSISATGGGLNPTDNLANSTDASNVIDTFYFSYEIPIPAPTIFNPLPFSQNLILRVDTTTYLSETPLDIIVDLTTIPFSDPSTLSYGEQIASRVVDSIYEYTRETNNSLDTKDNANVLGVLLGDYLRTTTVINSTNNTASEIPLEEYIDGEPQLKFAGLQSLASYDKDEKAGRVQIVAFRYRDKEYKIVVELKQVPPELWVATGNYILRRTQWGLGKRRGLTVDTKVLSSGSAVVQTSAEELNSVKASVSNIEASKSKLLQSVFDKRKHLNDAQKGFTNKWQYPT